MNCSSGYNGLKGSVAISWILSPAVKLQALRLKCFVISFKFWKSKHCSLLRKETVLKDPLRGGVDKQFFDSSRQRNSVFALLSCANIGESVFPEQSRLSTAHKPPLDGGAKNFLMKGLKGAALATATPAAHPARTVIAGFRCMQTRICFCVDLSIERRSNTVFPTPFCKRARCTTTSIR